MPGRAPVDDPAGSVDDPAGSVDDPAGSVALASPVRQAGGYFASLEQPPDDSSRVSSYSLGSSSGGSSYGGSSSSSGYDPRQPLYELTDHIILAGFEGSFVAFAERLHQGVGRPMPLVVLHPALRESTLLALAALGPVWTVKGRVTSKVAMEAARAKHARWRGRGGGAGEGG